MCVCACVCVCMYVCVCVCVLGKCMKLTVLPTVKVEVPVV